jgi:DNA-binding XRE family transcriptional regulator
MRAEMLGKPRLEIDGKRYVVLEEQEYERLCRAGGQALEADDLPAFPKPDRHGRFPAVEYVRVALARDLIRDRRALGLSQQQLARLANIRQETISRLETGKHTADPRTVDKLCAALDAERRRRAAQSGQ